MTAKRKSAPPFPSWRALPTELAPELYDVSIYARAIAIELFRSAPNDDEYAGVIRTSPQWEQQLCMLLRAKGKARANVIRHLRELKEAGILLVGVGQVTVRIGQPLVGTPSDSLQSTPGGTPLALHSTSTGTLSELRTESSNCNHSNSTPERRGEERKREESEERGREPLLHELIQLDYQSRYAQLYAASAPSDDTAARKLAKWCTETGAMQKREPLELARQVIAGLFETRDRKTVERRHPLRFAAHDPSQYVRVLKPIRVIENVGARLAREEDERLAMLAAERAALAAAAGGA